MKIATLNVTLVVGSVLGALALMASSSSAADPLRIMCIGDSITAGYVDNYTWKTPFSFGYRGPLHLLLTEAGYEFQFVGASPEPFDGILGVPSTIVEPNLRRLKQDLHRGYGGTVIRDLANGMEKTYGGLAAWLKDDNPDIVLLMVGINNISGFGDTGDPVDVERQLRDMVQTIVDVKPNAYVIVAQIAPYRTGQNTDSVSRYNRFIRETLVPGFAAQRKRVTAVDQYSNFLTPAGKVDATLYANVAHPNEAGYNRMAETWFQAIQAIVPASERKEDFGGRGITRAQMQRFLPLGKAHPFDDGDRHVVLQLQGGGEPVRMPAEIEWISKSWNRVDARCPYMSYMPERDRIVMVLLGGSLVSSDDHGKTWSPRRWDCPSMLGLTYLGQGRLMGFSEDLTSFCTSSDYGKTWASRASKAPVKRAYSWDPLLPLVNARGEIIRLVQACYQETGIAWGSTEGPYSQGGLRSSSDLGQTWSEPQKISQWLGANEINLIVAKNGDWIAACRTDLPLRFAPLKMDNYAGLGVSISKDAGKTWSPLKMLYEWGHHHPSMVILPDGRIVMSYVARLGYPNNAEGFPQFGIEAVVSSDDGETWDLDHRYILAAWVGQIKTPHWRYWGSAQSTSSVLMPDGTILTAFGTGFNITEAGIAKDIKDVALVRWKVAGPAAETK
jgi:lysophospholipase L1-like esterase